MESADLGAAPGPSRSEPEDWNEVLVRHLPLVRTFVRMNLDPGLRSREAISDLVQSSLREVVAARGRVRWQEEEAFRSWLFTCVTNKILDKKRYWNRQKRQQSREHSLDSDSIQLSSVLRSGPGSTPSALLLRGEQIQRLQEAFDSLNEREKKLFSMRFIFGLQPTHIGNELGSPESSVRKELARLQVTLLNTLGPLD